MKKIFFICSSQPPPTTIRKIDAVTKSENLIPFLIYWHRKKSLTTIPFTTKLNSEQIFRVMLSEPRGSLIKRALLNFMFFTKVFKIINKNRPEILHANNMDMLILCAVFNFFFKKIKLVLDLLDTRAFFLFGIWKYLAVFGLRRADLIHISSPKYYDEYLLNFEKILKKNILYIPNAPRKNEITPKKAKKQKIKTIGYIGAFRGKKAISGLVDTVYNLRKINTFFNIYFAGMGVDSPLVEKFSKEFDFVKYYGSFDYTLEASMLYSKVDIIYSIYELSHNKKIHLSCRFNDAVVSETPIVVQANSYQAELVSELEIGYVVELGKWKQLEKILCQLYGNSDDLEEIRVNCRNIKEKFMFETYEQNLLNAYNTLLNN